jgi:predicted Fe-Mo cluster-binding NifX family protein
MRVALAVDNNMVTEHFGHCEYFVVYDVQNKEIKGSEIVKNPPHQKGLLPKFLKEHQVDVVITGNMGKMAINICNSLGIECFRGVKGQLVDVINSYLDGSLVSNDSECNEHQHHGNC